MKSVIPHTAQLFLEIMGKHSNLMLVDDQRKIIEGFKHLTPNTNQYRTVMPGFQYEAPLPKIKQIHIVLRVQKF